MSQNKVVEFHNLVAKNLYATKQARPVNCQTITFLTRIVRVPDEDNFSKLVHFMQYITGTSTLPLIISANRSEILKWWVDASFSVHPNILAHSRGGLSLGCGIPIVRSTYQNIKEENSIQMEIVGFNNFIPAIFWTRYFIADQGYNVKGNCLHQDNKSYDLMENNGKALSS